MPTNKKFVTGLALGAAIGAGLTVFLCSSKGKKLVALAKTKLYYFNCELEKIIEKGQIFVDEMEAKISEG